jgi:hypothetical protein
MILIALGMGKSTRNELLVRRYLRAAGVAAVWVDADGHVGAQEVAKIDVEAGDKVYCCPRGAHFVLAYRLQLWMGEQPERPDQAALATKLEELAVAGGVGLTPHAVAVDRAQVAVANVNEAFGIAANNGDLREMKAAFKAARTADPSLRYADYLEARKAAMLEALVRALRFSDPIS